MRLLLLSWRDVKNPRSGGAEVGLHEVARQLCQRGHLVTLFTAGFPGGANEELVDGVRVIRRGRPWTVHLQAWLFYRAHPPGSFDAVIDEMHGIPFFPPIYVRLPKLLVVHEVAREIWFKMCPFPVALLGYLLEYVIFRCYRGVPISTASPSTRADVIRLGATPEQVSVFPQGLGRRPRARLPVKSVHPSLVFVGRLCAMKQVDHAVRALALIHQHQPAAQLWLVGAGDTSYVRHLKREAERLGIAGRVRFYGRVSEDEKFRILSQAWLLVSASAKEGWGLIVVEANAMGTPAVTYDVPGYRDSVRDGVTGLLCSPITPAALASAAVRLIEDKDLYRRLQRQALEYSGTFSWSNRTDQYLNMLTAAVESASGSRGAPGGG